MGDSLSYLDNLLFLTHKTEKYIGHGIPIYIVYQELSNNLVDHFYLNANDDIFQR